LCRFLQESAGNHAQDLGVSIDTLLSQGITWILSRFHIKIHRCPRWRERIRIETWPSNAMGCYVFRDFKIFNDQDELLISASSIWLIIDVKRRVPLRIPEHIVEMRVTDRERALSDSFDTIWRPEQVSLEKRFSVRCSDLDLNQHVNNVSYVEWAVETVPDNIWQTHQITEIEVSFRAEGLYGNVVISQSGQTEEDGQPLFTHRIIRESDGAELFLARTRWEQNEES
jgi:acyl-ACP thioesterase